jgi:hypothetical protein
VDLLRVVAGKGCSALQPCHVCNPLGILGCVCWVVWGHIHKHRARLPWTACSAVLLQLVLCCYKLDR